ncbi:hypothetical protein MYAM1_002004 [Malassezia yamatoensis]|uniref:Uncharacterized protein n=1 Tax=Malassezia yamatoensis TaxID=253288 RepID=A0AAJ5YTT4_9BASI|nr:hypothetical protein MYAM1_002004 [Malassezia yamatoensis]
MLGLWHFLIVLIAVMQCYAKATQGTSAEASPAPRVWDVSPRSAPSVTQTASSESKPTASLERRYMRSVPLSTLAPQSVYIPGMAGDEHANGPADTSIYYFGHGYYSESSIFALVTGTDGVGSGAATTLLYQGPTEAYLANVLRTVDLGGNNGTVTARFNVDCFYEDGFNKEGYCQYGMIASAQTTMITTYNSTASPQTTITPVLGLLEQMRASTASGPKSLNYPKTQADAQNAAGKLSSLFSSSRRWTAIAWTVFWSMLLAVWVL